MCWSYDIDTPDATTTLEIIGLPEYPTPPGGRDLSDEYEDILQTELEYAPLIFEMEKNMQPAYAQLAYETQKRLLTMPGGQLDLAQRIQPQVSTTDAAYTTAQREADITDVENLGARAVAAYEESTPELQSLLDASTQAALNPLESDISQELERQAYDQLTSAGYLTEP